MGLFDNNKKIKTMESKVSKLDNWVTKTATNWDAWRNGTNMTLSPGSSNYKKISSEFNSIGDPYVYNVIVRKAINKVAENIAQVPFNIMNGDKEVAPTDKWVKLFNYVNDMDDSYDMIYDVVVNLQRFGKAFIVTSEQSLGGVPISMQTVPANHMKAVKNKDNTLRHWLFDDKIIYLPERVLFMRYRHPTNPYDGLSPLSSAVIPILNQFYSEAYNINFFKNGGHPKGYWTRENGFLNGDQVNEANKALNDTFGGVDQSHKQLSIPRGLTYHTISTNQKDMEFNQLLERTRDDILFALDVPKAIMGFVDTTFNNMEEAKKSFWTMSLLPIMTRLEKMFATNFFDKRGIPYTIEFATDTIPELQEDNMAKGTTAKIYYDMGVPFNVLNERFGLEFEEFPEWDAKPNQAAPNPFQLEANVPETKSIGVKKSEFAIQIEYKMSLEYMLRQEKELYKSTKGFYTHMYKDVIKYLKEEKAVTDPDFIARYVAYLKGLKKGKDLVEKINPNIEGIFNAGAKTIYNEVGVAWDLSDKRAIDHLVRRGLILQDSPDAVVQSIIDMMEADDFTIDNLAKDISKKWDTITEASAKLIAITETTAAYSTGKETGMKELGIKRKRWANSGDSKVRDSHKDSATGVFANVGEPFANGLMRPGDGGAKDACGCRCVLIADL